MPSIDLKEERGVKKLKNLIKEAGEKVKVLKQNALDDHFYRIEQIVITANRHKNV